MSLLQTTYSGTQNDKIQLAVTFDTIIRHGAVDVEIKLYEGDPSTSQPAGTETVVFPTDVFTKGFNLAPRDGLSVAGTLTWNNGGYIFNGTAVNSGAVLINFKDGIVSAY
ncbi:MAG TPA: hypothetical protein DCE41_21710 [Cytophagales bacterium]|nr:hypothetical protein [Cytophagales bacterium]HAA24245.1 hypothetical protein [Cytophagales bacterium]HAP58446.1 hypothetical protein [Cytophagales bacterium]